MPPETDPGDKIPQAVEVQLTHLLGEVADLFRAPRVTLVVRSPQLPGGALVLTDDDLGLAVEAIQRLAARDERRPKPPPARAAVTPAVDHAPERGPGLLGGVGASREGPLP